MSSATSIDLPHRIGPRLRVVRDMDAGQPARRDRAEEPARTAPSKRLLHEPAGATAPAGAAEPAGAAASVLVAGEDPGRRAQMLSELRGLLPGGTPFEEAVETWQVIARAANSRMVVLTGDLGDISAQGLMRVLGRRYPLLPVIALGAHSRATPSGSLDAASL